ncbi:transposable element Tcb2 transposase [Trichonephila clavipes]|nr:transposable element Tcb2 transposase [Trichonephila clavipes]
MGQCSKHKSSRAFEKSDELSFHRNICRCTNEARRIKIRASTMGMTRIEGCSKAFGDGSRHFKPWSSDENDTANRTTMSVHHCPTRWVLSGAELELVTKPATIRYLYHSATAATTQVRTINEYGVWIVVAWAVSAQTVRNGLHSAGLKARTPRTKPYISEVTRKSLEFAMKYKNKPMDFWKKVIFSDESKSEIFTPPSIRKIWRKNKTALELKNVLPTLKHGGGNVMVWRCEDHNGAGNLAFVDNKMNVSAYIDVLRHNLLDNAKKLSMENSFTFQQDNDPKHTAIVTKTWLLYYAPNAT